MGLTTFKYKPSNNALCLGVIILHIRSVLNSRGFLGEHDILPGATRCPPRKIWVFFVFNGNKVQFLTLPSRKSIMSPRNHENPSRRKKSELNTVWGIHKPVLEHALIWNCLSYSLCVTLNQHTTVTVDIIKFISGRFYFGWCVGVLIICVLADYLHGECRP